MLETSESIKEIMPSLIKSQNEIRGLIKTGKGYDYNYLKFEPMITISKEVLNQNELFLTQSIVTFEQEGNEHAGCQTTIYHASGEWIKSDVVSSIVRATPGKGGTMKPQNIRDLGSTFTYLKRYQLAAMLGLVSEDDDGGAAALARTKAGITMTDNQKNAIIGLVRAIGMNQETFAISHVPEHLGYIKDFERLNIEEADILIKSLQNLKNSMNKQQQQQKPQQQQSQVQVDKSEVAEKKTEKLKTEKLKTESIALPEQMKKVKELMTLKKVTREEMGDISIAVLGKKIQATNMTKEQCDKMINHLESLK